jgi:hypothetical protein
MPEYYKCRMDILQEATIGGVGIRPLAIVTDMTTKIILSCLWFQRARQISRPRGLKDTKPLFLGFLLNLLLLLWGHLAAHCDSLEFLFGLGLVLAEDYGDGVLGLDAMHLHEVAALGDVVDVAGAMVAGLDGLVLFVLDNDIPPGIEEVNGVGPECGDGGDEVLEGRVVGVVHEEGEDAEEEESALMSCVLVGL